jgi:hypothetical protein
MPRHAIYQIYYSEATRIQLDPGFVPLDNLANERPDWREYWPIRNHLLAHPPRSNAFTGYFSPKFKDKTGLDAANVHTFLDSQGQDVDAVLFSPFFDQIALYWSIFEQGFNHHPDALKTFSGAVNKILPGTRIDRLSTDSRNTVFSNFFVARPRFLKEWLRLNEILFDIAESGTGALATGLNSDVTYGKEAVPAKVFMMERVATLMLAVQPGWRVAVHDPLKCPLDPMFAPYRLELICMDALKIASTARDAAEYRDAFRFIRQRISDHSKSEFARKKKK